VNIRAVVVQSKLVPWSILLLLLLFSTVNFQVLLKHFLKTPLLLFTMLHRRMLVNQIHFVLRNIWGF